VTQASKYESDEVSQVLVSVDEILHEQSTNDCIAQIAGDGNGSSPRSTGWQHAQLNTDLLPAGTHTSNIRGYKDRKTYNDESPEILIDDVQVTATSD
jgi:hypothetical protein